MGGAVAGVTTPLVTAGGRTIAADSPGGRVLRRIQQGEMVTFYGACTPFRARLLEELNHFDAWVSSFELSALLGERDDESIGFAETRFFVGRIHRCCPNVNLFIDCDTGWTDDPEALATQFAELSDQVAMVSLENLAHGRKDNSFLPHNGSELADPDVVAAKLRTIADVCRNVVIVLRLENNILGRSLAETVRYVRQLRRAGAPYDMLLLHHRGPEPDPLLAFADAVRSVDQDTPLASIATSYLQSPNLLARLHRSRHRVVVIPNYAIRHEYRTTRRVYEQLIAAEYAEVEAGAAGMDDIFQLVYRPQVAAREPSVSP